MKRTTLYSRHIEPTPEKPEGDLVLPASAQPASVGSTEPPRHQRLKERLVVLTIGILIGGLTLYVSKHTGPSQPTLTQEHIDAAVLHTLATKDLPSRAARASAAIAPSVVRIRTDVLSPSGGTQISDNALGVGTGVVIKWNDSDKPSCSCERTQTCRDLCRWDGIASRDRVSTKR